MKNVFKSQFKMIEFPGQIHGYGSHDENVFLFLVREGCFGRLDVNFIGFSGQFNGHFIRNECKIRENETKMKGNRMKSCEN